MASSGCLECFRAEGDESPVLSINLAGLTIDNAAPCTKRELSLKLLQFDRVMLCLEVRKLEIIEKVLLIFTIQEISLNM